MKVLHNISTTSLKIQSSVDPDSSKVACHESGNPQVLVPFHSPSNIKSNYNDFRTMPSISSSGGFFLERFRELLDPAVEEVASKTGGYPTISFSCVILSQHLKRLLWHKPMRKQVTQTTNF
jgi:hypothetical protein